MAISAGLTDSASYHQADIEGSDQVFTDLQGCSCKQYIWGRLAAARLAANTMLSG